MVPVLLPVLMLAAEWLARKSLRRDVFAAAERRARETGRTLLVVGDPDGGLTHGDYGYGDVCVDLTGCPGAPRGVAIDLSTGVLPLQDDSAVVFCPFVLEYVPDIDHAFGELLRVAGSAENLFIMTLKPWELATYVYPGARWMIEVSGQTMRKKSVVRGEYIRARALGR